MRNYYRDLLVCWTLIMILHGDIITKMVSRNPIIPFLIVTFVDANLLLCVINIIIDLIKKW